MPTNDFFVSVEGQRLYVQHTVTHPSRPTLVFLHDSLGCVRLWRDFPHQLAEATGCNLLVYDRRGYGESEPMDPTPRTNRYMEIEADLLAALLHQLGIADAILFGHSDGASIALIAASKHGALVRGLISEAAHIFVEDLTLDGIRAAVTAYAQTDLKTRLEKYHGDKTEALFHAWTDTWLRKEYRHWSLESFLPGITCPTLIIQGEVDEYGTLAQVSGIENGVNGKVSKLILPGVGHTPHREAAETVLAASIDFIRALPGV